MRDDMDEDAQEELTDWVVCKILMTVDTEALATVIDEVTSLVIKVYPTEDEGMLKTTFP